MGKKRVVPAENGNDGQRKNTEDISFADPDPGGPAKGTKAASSSSAYKPPDDDRGKAVGALREKREEMRRKEMEDVLAEFHAKEEEELDMPEVMPTRKIRRWPLYNIRKLLRLAHVDLFDAVLDGKRSVVLQTLKRYHRKFPGRINDQDTGGRTALSLAIKIGREDIAHDIMSQEDVDYNKAKQKRNGNNNHKGKDGITLRQVEL